MIDRQSAGLFPDKPHTVCRAPDGKLLYEEMFTRGGFSGPFSYFYHRHPITPHREVALSDRRYGLNQRRYPRVRVRNCKLPSFARKAGAPA